MYKVGVEIAPGTYRTEGRRPATPSCLWARFTKGASGGPEHVADATLNGGGTVTVSETDSEFVTAGCQPWARV